MTVLIGASVLLIAGSAVALVFGWTGADQTLIWTSIAATAAAAVTLALAYFRSRNEPAPSEGPSSPAAEPGAAPAATSTAASTAGQVPPQQAAASGEAEESSPEGAAASSEPAAAADGEEAEATAEPPPTQEVPAAAPPRAKPTVRKLEVVAIASTKKFHRPDCRYASSSGAAKMSKGEARKQGFAPCGVCKP